MISADNQHTTNKEDFPDATMIDSALRNESYNTWSGNDAPVDDFNDPASAEGLAHATEVSEGMDERSDSSSTKAGRQLKWLPVGAALAGAVFIGAMMYLQFGNSSSPQHVAIPHTKPLAEKQAPAARTQDQASTSTTNQASENDVAPTSSLTPIIVANGQNDAATPEAATGQKGFALPGANAPTATASPTATTSVAEWNGAPTLEKNPDVKNLQDHAVPVETRKSSPKLILPEHEQPATSAANGLPTTASEPSQQAIPTAAPALPTTTPPNQEAPPPPTPQLAQNPAPQADFPAPSSTDSRISALTTQIESLKKELEETQQRLAQANERIQDLQASKPPKPSSAISHMSMEDNIMLGLAPKEAVSQRTRKKAASTASHESRSARKNKSIKTSSTREKLDNAPTNAWVLRAASPDEAWVAKGEDSRALQPVRVGDTLQGVGRVTAIRQDGSTWVIEGTQGVVR